LHSTRSVRSFPLAIDLCCGLGGWTEGLLAEGWRVRGYDIEAHEYGEERYPAELVLRNVLEMHGSEIADADLIVASPPCTEYSYMAMPWSRAKQIARALRGEDEFPEPYRGSRTIEQLNAIFDACFRFSARRRKLRAGISR
jgi:site-specific DNA-cytosine methylase